MSLQDAVQTYDIFLSYSSSDRPVVRGIAERLRKAGMVVWFDQDSLVPGGSWQQGLAKGLRNSKSCAVFVGPNAIAGWELNEMELALDRSTQDPQFRVFPVVLPGIPYFDPAAMLPPFLNSKQWIDLRQDVASEEAVEKLIDGIRGISPPVVVAADDGRACPYRGLAVFEEEHAPFFFGREAQVQRLVEALRQSRFLAVLGQSGVGKSSLVRAGLVASLRTGALPGIPGWRVLPLRPGPLPLTTLAAKLRKFHPATAPTVDALGSSERMLNGASVVAMADEPAGSKLLVIVDQFEELFTLCTDGRERVDFLANLLFAATFPHGPAVVVIAMRADFYPRLAEFPEFAQVVQARQVLVPALNDRELRDVIEKPAHAVGVEIDTGLADTILDEVAREPGALPLLEDALLETWQHRRGSRITLADYRAAGGVGHALGDRAEAVYDRLSDVAREQARQVFLRLVQPGDGTEDTRRRVAASEITTGADVAADVVRQFADARLLTTGAEDGVGPPWVDIAHEVVITGWDRCARWVEGSRADLIVHRRLILAAQEWNRLNRSRDALYRGVPLAEATAWRARTDVQLNWLEVDFLDAGSAAVSAQRRSRRRWITAGLTALLTALAVIAVIAGVAMNQRDVATSRQLAVEARDTLAMDPALSLALALRAVDAAQTPQADEVLRQATADSHALKVISGPGGAVYGVRLLPGGHQVVTGSEDGVVRIWNLADGTLARQFSLHRGRVLAVRVSPDGQTIASAGIDATIRLTQLATGQSRVLPMPSAIANVAVSHDGTLLAASLGDGSVHLVDLRANQEKVVLRAGGGKVFGAAFSADDAMLAAALGDGSVPIWRLADGTVLHTLRPSGGVYGVDFSPTGSRVATAGADGLIRLWDAATGEGVAALGSPGTPVFVVRFGPGGKLVGGAGLDGTVGVWTDQGFALSPLRGHAGFVEDMDFEQTGDRMVTGGVDGSVRAWVVQPDPAVHAPATGATFDHAGTRIVSGGTDGRLRLWRRADLAPLLDIPDHTGRSQAVFSSDGSRVLSFGDDGAVTIRSAADGKYLAGYTPGVGRIRALAPDPTDQRIVVGGESGLVVLEGDERTVLLGKGASPVNAAQFSPDGTQIVAGRDDGSITLWGPDHVAATVKPADGESVYDTVFSPDGTRIASVDASGGVDLWDVRGEQPPVALRGHTRTASAVSFRGDGAQLVSSGADGTVRVWDPSTGELFMTFADLDGPASFVDISADGTAIVKTAESDGTLRLLSCTVCGPAEAVTDAARAHVVRDLSADEKRRFAVPD